MGYCKEYHESPLLSRYLYRGRNECVNCDSCSDTKGTDEREKGRRNKAVHGHVSPCCIVAGERVLRLYVSVGLEEGVSKGLERK